MDAYEETLTMSRPFAPGIACIDVPNGPRANVASSFAAVQMNDFDNACGVKFPLLRIYQRRRAWRLFDCRVDDGLPGGFFFLRGVNEDAP